MPWRLFYRILGIEERLVEHILRQPGWHRFVGRIHRRVDEFQNGPMPNQSTLRPGQATEDPNRRGFVYHFVEEIKSAFRQPNGPPPPPGKK
ncbi:hypothetical protein PspLS_01834 [Pyricularia sp. CBS 133598]|nr:hypothetical protein PspLS_01834 [Pyricularia sp. CBS 133598]